MNIKLGEHNTEARRAHIFLPKEFYNVKSAP